MAADNKSRIHVQSLFFDYAFKKSLFFDYAFKKRIMAKKRFFYEPKTNGNIKNGKVPAAKKRIIPAMV